MPTQSNHLDEHELFKPISLTAYKSVEDLPGLPAAWDDRLAGPGLALVFEANPAMGGEVKSGRSTLLDDVGEDLSFGLNEDKQWFVGDITREAVNPPLSKVYTLLMRGPNVGAKQLETWLSARETRLGARTTIEFAPFKRGKVPPQ